MGGTSDGARSFGPLLDGLRATFASGRTRDPAWRRGQLEALLAMLEARGPVLVEALAADMGKPRFEALAGELRVVVTEARFALANLDAWLQPGPEIRVPGLGIGRVRCEPRGLVLIIGPWNYPVQLVLLPLVAAIAAGNAAVLKPSEVTQQTSRALAELTREFLDGDAIAVVEGGPDRSAALLEHPFDHVFFTGGTNAGRRVFAAAAAHLTPVTLELGGKSPCIVLRDADLEQAARRIAWGKYLNAGQVCVAPDYVLADAPIEAELVARLGDAIRAFFGADPRRSADYGRIVNREHFRRLAGMLDGLELVHGGERDEDERYLAPTVARNVSPQAAVMGEEIFGPILPVLRVDGLDEAVRFVTGRPKPLAMYLFSSSAAAQQRVIEETSSGGLCFNDVVTHIIPPELPFGGVGQSGIGTYHGIHGFETFSHRKTIFHATTGASSEGRFPPHDERKLRLLGRLK